MNLKEAIKNLSDEELSELLNEIVNRQLEKAKEKEEPNHYYVFTGTWDWGVWAKSEEEAERYMEEAPIEDFELNFERVEVEVNDQ